MKTVLVSWENENSDSQTLGIKSRVLDYCAIRATRYRYNTRTCLRNISKLPSLADCGDKTLLDNNGSYGNFAQTLKHMVVRTCALKLFLNHV